MVPITCANLDAHPSTPPFGVVPRTRKLDCSGNQVVFSDESRFNHSSDDNRVRVWRPRGEGLNRAFALQRHNTPTAGVMVSQDYLGTVTILLCPARSLDFSNRAYLGSFGTASWGSHEFERTRGKVAANMERNVSRHHTELVCLNSRSYRIVHSC
ncbi:transposable element Tcb1 transposase [Trichonephila clavipes]|nr:transposable element Tcb1 transposase [Trichonephila clavipes]